MNKQAYRKHLFWPTQSRRRCPRLHPVLHRLNGSLFPVESIERHRRFSRTEQASQGRKNEQGRVQATENKEGCPKPRLHGRKRPQTWHTGGHQLDPSMDPSKLAANICMAFSSTHQPPHAPPSALRDEKRDGGQRRRYSWQHMVVFLKRKEELHVS
jgi:hypothetical protein